MNDAVIPDSTSGDLYQEAVATLKRLLAEATHAGDPEPTAMTLATVDARARVSSRIVLLKGLAEDGLRFFTNYESAKAEQLDGHNQAALCFHWKTLGDQVQVRIEGHVGKLGTADSNAYFATRPRPSQIGAWASLQSQTLPSRDVFDVRIAEAERRFSAGNVPRPAHWGGYLLVPDLFEFWYGAKYRWHERQRYELCDGVWTKRQLYP